MFAVFQKNLIEKDNRLDKYRHELKFLCSSTDLLILEQRLSCCMERDIHAGSSGCYSIRSVYFDDMLNSSYYDNEAGYNKREKFRIRIYDGQSNPISLELKKKECEMTHKSSCQLTKAQCDHLLTGKPLPYDPSYPPILQKLLIAMRIKMMKPSIIVEYERIPFVSPNGNVRITFDKYLRSSTYMNDFFEPVIIGRPVMPSGLHLLEVKYDEFLPDYIHHSLELNKLKQTDFSKYFICRNYSFKGDLL